MKLLEERPDLVAKCAAHWFLVLEIRSGIPTNKKKKQSIISKKISRTNALLSNMSLFLKFSPCFWQTLHWNIYKWQVWETCFLQYLCKIIIKSWWREITIGWSQVSVKACYCISKYDRNHIHFPNTVKKELCPLYLTRYIKFIMSPFCDRNLGSKIMSLTGHKL